MKMWVSTMVCALIASTMGGVVAQSPPGILPTIQNVLITQFAGGTWVNAGGDLAAYTTSSLPQLGLPVGQGAAVGQKYLFMMFDIDSRDGKAKSAAPASPFEGTPTFLNVMIQDFIITKTGFGGGGVLLSQRNNGPTPYVAPIPASNQTHRYMVVLFDQPTGWKLNAQLQQTVSNREGFDVRAFMANAQLPVPRWANWFTVDGSSAAATSPSAGGNAGGSPNGVAGGAAGGAVGDGPRVITYSDGGPTVTFVGGANGVRTSLNPIYLTTITQPNGGPTSTFLTSGLRTGFSEQPAQTLSPSNGEIGKEPGLGSSGDSGLNNVGGPDEIFYTTGFTGLRTLSAMGIVPHTVTSTLANGAVTTIVTTDSVVSTRVYSGAPAVAMTTMSIPTTITSTGVEVVSGTSRTVTSTFITSVPTVITTPVLSKTSAGGRNDGRGGALLAAVVAGAALVVL